MNPSDLKLMKSLQGMLKECVEAIEQGNKVVPQSVRGYLAIIKDREKHEQDLMIREAKDKEDEERALLHKLTKKYEGKHLYEGIPGVDPNEPN